MTITTRIHTALFGEPVGTDQFGNRYFRSIMRRAHLEGNPSRSRKLRSFFDY